MRAVAGALLLIGLALAGCHREPVYIGPTTGDGIPVDADDNLANDTAVNESLPGG